VKKDKRKGPVIFIGRSTLLGPPRKGGKEAYHPASAGKKGNTASSSRRGRGRENVIDLSSAAGKRHHLQRKSETLLYSGGGRDERGGKERIIKIDRGRNNTNVLTMYMRRGEK